MTMENLRPQKKTHQDCPECGHKGCYTDFGNGSGYCMSCGFKKLPESLKFKKEHIEEIKLKEEAVLTLKPKQMPNKKTDLIEFEILTLSTRMISADTCRAFNYGVGRTENGAVQVANYYDKHGRVCAQKTRTVDKDFFWIGNKKKATMFGQNLWANERGSLVICEGEIDALSIYQASQGRQAVVSVQDGASSAEKSISTNIDFVEQFSKVILWFDNDDAGQEGLAKCMDIISPAKIHIITVEDEIKSHYGEITQIKDANDLLKAGRADEIIRLIESAKQYAPDDIKNAADITLEQFNKCFKKGHETSFPKLNDAIKGIKEGCVYTLAAKPKAGKTTFITDILMNFARNGIKCGVFSLEEPVEKTSARLFSFLEGVPPWKIDNMHDLQRTMIFERRQKELDALNIDVFNPKSGLTTNIIKSRMRHMILANKVKIIFFDNFSKISATCGMDLQYMNRFFQEINDLCRNSDTALINVVHLKKNGRHDETGEEKPITDEDVYGSGDFGKFSDTLLAIEQSGEQSVIKVVYDRNASKKNFYCDVINYDPETGRLNTSCRSGLTLESREVGDLFGNV